jgi:hypothetical protein
VSFLTAYLLREHSLEGGGGPINSRSLQFVPLVKVLSRLRLNEAFMHPELPLAVRLFVNEVVLKHEAYARGGHHLLILSHICHDLLEATEKVVAQQSDQIKPESDQTVAAGKTLDEVRMPYIMENLLLVNTLIQSIANGDFHPESTSLQGIQLPSIDSLEVIINMAQKAKIEFSYETPWLDSLPHMIIYQTLQTLQYHAIQAQ